MRNLLQNETVLHLTGQAANFTFTWCLSHLHVLQICDKKMLFHP